MTRGRMTIRPSTKTVLRGTETDDLGQIGNEQREHACEQDVFGVRPASRNLARGPAAEYLPGLVAGSKGSLTDRSCGDRTPSMVALGVHEDQRRDPERGARGPRAGLASGTSRLGPSSTGRLDSR